MAPQIPSASICPSCMFGFATRLAYQNVRRPWAAQRLYSGRQRSAPSRMVLSDRVDRPPNRRPGQDGYDRKKPERKWESPFGAMNQTSVRGLAPRPPPKRDSRDDRGGNKRGGKGDERRTKAMKMQGSLATIGYGHRSRIKDNIRELDSFDKFDLIPEIKESISGELLQGLTDVQPTPVQRVGIPALLGQQTGKRSRTRANREKDDGSPNRQEFMLAAETGSGKTLTYLLPVVNALKQAEAADPAITAYREYFQKQREAMDAPDYTGPRMFDPHPTAARPKVIILVPTAELVDQVGATAKSLSHAVKFKSSRFSANVSAKVINREMYAPGGIDMIIATPHLLASMADSDPNILSRVTHLVVDEADSLFDRSFSPVTTSILDRALPSLKQLILCSATIPKRLDSYVAAQFPDMVRITTPNLHAIPRRVQMGVIDVVKDPYRNNKNLACADAIWSIGKEAARMEQPSYGNNDDNTNEVDVKRIMVFVNEREKTQEVADYLVSKGIDAVALHRDTPEQRQSEALDSFTTRQPMKKKVAKSDPAPSPVAPVGKRSLPNTKVIVATDLASRGIDTLAVRHVILYDVPHTTIDFIHRLGRAGRMGRRGRGIVLLGRGDKADVVAEVRESMYMGQALI